MESGRIKDQRRITSFKQYIVAIDNQLLELDTNYQASEMPQPEKQDADLGFEDIGSRNENLKSENDIPKDLQVLSSAAEDAVAQADQPSPDSKLSSPNTTNKAQRFRSTLIKAPPKKLTVEEKIEQGLFETFNFYSRQHIKANVGFDEMDEMMKKIDLGEFTCFTRDF